MKPVQSEATLGGGLYYVEWNWLKTLTVPSAWVVLKTPHHTGCIDVWNSKAIWDLINEYLMQFRDWMSSNGNSQYSFDHSLYIAEKGVFLNFYEQHPNSVICLTVLIVKYYIHMLCSINIRPTVFINPTKLQSVFTQILNSKRLSKSLSKKAKCFEQFLSWKIINISQANKCKICPLCIHDKAFSSKSMDRWGSFCITIPTIFMQLPWHEKYIFTSYSNPWPTSMLRNVLSGL